MPRADSLRSLIAARDTRTSVDCVLSDVWGVLHNGVDAYPPAVEALRGARSGGACVVLVTNSPRPREGVEAQLAELGIGGDSFDAIVTSGDVTRELIRAAPPELFVIGPERDQPLLGGTNARAVPESEARTVLCTGLFDDETETPEDYAPLLERLRARDLPMIVANPDIVVERGDRLVWCAGALGHDYEALGGEVRVAGKPHTPIYRAALARASDVLGHAPRNALAIGDGMPTDVRGGLRAGLPLVFITGGIHAAEYGGAEADPVFLQAFFEREGVWPVEGDETDSGSGRIVAWMPHLA